MQQDYANHVRQLASEHFLEQFFTGKDVSAEFENLVVHRNKLGQQTARVALWTGRGPTYLDQSLSDLLDLGDLLQRMQDHLDATYGVGEFRVFNHRVRGNRNRTMSLTVSWDKERFENVDRIIEENRLHAAKRQQRHRGGDDVDEDEDEEVAAPRATYRPAARESRDGPRRYESRDGPRRYESRDGPRRYEPRDGGRDGDRPSYRRERPATDGQDREPSSRPPREQREYRAPRETHAAPREERTSRRRAVMSTVDA